MEKQLTEEQFFDKKWNVEIDEKSKHVILFSYNDMIKFAKNYNDYIIKQQIPTEPATEKEPVVKDGFEKYLEETANQISKTTYSGGTESERKALYKMDERITNIYNNILTVYKSFSPVSQTKDTKEQKGKPYASKGMEKLEIYRFQAEQFEDTFRMIANAYGSRDKKTCLDRDIMVSYEMAKNVLSGEIDKPTNRMGIVDLEPSQQPDSSQTKGLDITDEENAINFAEWIINNGWEYINNTEANIKGWSKKKKGGFLYSAAAIPLISTSELRNKFLSQTNKGGTNG